MTLGFTPQAAGEMAINTFLNLGAGQFTSHELKVPENSQIKGSVRLEAQNPIRNVGILIQDPHGVIVAAPSYVFEAIEGSHTRDGWGFNMNFNLSSPKAFGRSLTKNIACSNSYQ